jgi:4-diphosphocytidyl-2-C-methyl-D-erythritol kinase
MEGVVIERVARAKINLTLRVLGKRGDGFHEIETLIVPVGLADRVTVEEGDGFEFSCDDPTVPGDEGNLVVRAARLFFKETGVKEGVRVGLYKRIPHGAGLGGGSSDAAATLRALDKFYGTGLAREKLMGMGA